MSQSHRPHRPTVAPSQSVMANGFIVSTVAEPAIRACRKTCTLSPALSAKPSISARTAPASIVGL